MASFVRCFEKQVPKRNSGVPAVLSALNDKEEPKGDVVDKENLRLSIFE